MGLFTRKKKTAEPVTEFHLLTGSQTPLVPFGSNISKSDVVMVCIDRIATHCAKLKMRLVKKDESGKQVEKHNDISFVLKFRPNELMTPYQFIYKSVTLLLLNDNAFIYPKYDKNTYEILGIYPLNPIMVQPIMYSDNSLSLKFYFEDGSNYELPYENVIHLKNFYGKNEVFGGSGYSGDHEALLKTIKINDALLQGVEGAIYSSFKIRGLLKINGMLKETDKQKQIDEFNRMLEKAIKSDSSIVPMDNKAEYTPLQSDPKLVDAETLKFTQGKILEYFGVSPEVYSNSYDENQFNAFYESRIEPIAIQLGEAFSLGLLTHNQLKNGEEIIFFSERLQYASWTTKVGAIEKLMGLGIMSLNESRAILGLEPVEGGDKRLQSLNYVDASKANKYQVDEDDNPVKKEDNEDEKQ